MQWWWSEPEQAGGCVGVANAEEDRDVQLPDHPKLFTVEQKWRNGLWGGSYGDVRIQEARAEAIRPRGRMSAGLVKVLLPHVSLVALTPRLKARLGFE